MDFLSDLSNDAKKASCSDGVGRRDAIMEENSGEMVMVGEFDKIQVTEESNLFFRLRRPASYQ